jgi:hypothetical protein
MATITASLVGTILPKNVLVTVASLAAGDTVTVYRVYSGARQGTVRGAVGVVPGSALVVADVQAPFGIATTYDVEITATSGTLTTLTSAGVTVTDPGRHHLSDPYTGDGVFVDLVAPVGSRSRAGQGSFVRPARRARGISLYDVRAAPAGSMTVFTRTAAESDSLDVFLASGAPIVSRKRNAANHWPASEVIAVGATTDAAVGRGPEARWTLEFNVVGDPDPSLPASLWTLQDIRNSYPAGTLQDIRNSYPAGTLLTLAQVDWP